MERCVEDVASVGRFVNRRRPEFRKGGPNANGFNQLTVALGPPWRRPQLLQPSRKAGTAIAGRPCLRLPFHGVEAAPNRRRSLFGLFFDIHRLDAGDLTRRNLSSLLSRFAQRDRATVGKDPQALAVDMETDASLPFRRLLLREATQGTDVASEVTARFEASAKEGDLMEKGSFLGAPLFESRQQGGGEILDRQRATLPRQAARRFGAGTAAGLEALSNRRLAAT